MIFGQGVDGEDDRLLMRLATIKTNNNKMKNKPDVWR